VLYAAADTGARDMAQEQATNTENEGIPVKDLVDKSLYPYNQLGWTLSKGNPSLVNAAEAYAQSIVNTDAFDPKYTNIGVGIAKNNGETYIAVIVGE
jgi:hypothetical protein